VPTSVAPAERPAVPRAAAAADYESAAAAPHALAAGPGGLGGAGGQNRTRIASSVPGDALATTGILIHLDDDGSEPSLKFTAGPPRRIAIYHDAAVSAGLGPGPRPVQLTARLSLSTEYYRLPRHKKAAPGRGARTRNH
jgi:hypothetical protein